MPFRQIKPNLDSLLFPAAILCLFLLWSCGDGNSVSKNSVSGTGALSFNIVYHDDADGSLPSNSARIDCADLALATVEAIVYGPDDTPPAVGGPWSCDTGRGAISSVPAGSDRTVVVLGKDADGMVALRGQKSGINIIADKENKVGPVECYSFVPNLLSPADGAVVFGDVATFEWEDVAGATEYRVNISQNSDMKSPLIKEFTATLDYIAAGLDLETTYYWQVFARDSDENMGRGSQTRSIQITQFSPKLPDTGQEHIESYTPVPGEDMTYTINPPSYTKLDADGNELDPDAVERAIMVKDEVTGLVWEIKTDDDTIHDKDNTYNWQDAEGEFIAALNDSQFGGYDDWRLPTVKELAVIVHRGNHDPAIDTNYFPNTVEPLGYWSATQYVAGSAWTLAFDDGNAIEASMSGLYHVRAVRGRLPDDNLVDNGDGTVTDAVTGLMWQQLEAGLMIWTSAIDYCETLELAGYDDWRLPNTNELQSIVDYERGASESGPAIDTAFFPNAEPSYYWTSTTLVYSTGDAWKLNFRQGQFGSHIKLSGNYYVRAVRGK